MQPPSQIQYCCQESGRLDQVLVSSFPQFSRGFLQQLIDAGHVLVNGRSVRKSHRTQPGDIVVLNVPEPELVALDAEDLAVQKLYEDEDIIAVHKPAGMLTHPVGQHTSGTLVNALLHLSSSLGSINGTLRPGIVHRLDRETSGLILVAKNDLAQRNLSAEFHERRIRKVYYAFASGMAQIPRFLRVETGLSRDPVRRNLRRIDQAGKPAVSLIRPLHGSGRIRLFRVQILTGRTHQIRLHLKHVGYPLLGDRDYGGRVLSPFVERVMLHSFLMEFDHPRHGQRMRIVCPWPQDMVALFQAVTSNQVQ